METEKTGLTSVRSPPDLSLSLLGELSLGRAGAGVALPASKRTRALLGFLIANPGPHARQTLCDLLWEGPDDPRAALRWSLTKLRPLLNDVAHERLLADREHVEFLPTNAWTDVGAIGELSRGNDSTVAALERAAHLFRGEFLDGLELPSCYRFHHWCMAERERWGSVRRTLLTQLIDGLADHPDRALPFTRMLVAADPLSELAHGTLVDLLAKLGRRDAAAEHYVYARAMLARETGAPLTGELRRPPSARAAPPLASTASATAAEVAAGQTIIGREREKALIAQILASATKLQDGKSGAIFLGEPGIGKSSLLRHAAAQAASLGYVVLSARCFEAEAIRPYGCWIDMLSKPLAAKGETQGLTSPFEVDVALQTASATIGRTSLFSSLVTYLGRLAADSSVLVSIDDMQWIDEGSASLLHYVLRNPTSLPKVTFLGGGRSGEIEDNRWARGVMEGLLTVELGPLAATDAARFFAPHTSTDRLAHALRQSGGNPFLLEELATADTSDSTADFDTLVTGRLARLSTPENDILQFASATARDFQPETIGEALGMADIDLVAALDRLERRGLLKATPKGTVDFAHDLFRQATYRALSQPKRRMIHRQLARVMERHAKNNPSLWGELAYHSGSAGEHGQAVEACTKAGEHCLRVFANAAAVDIADQGLAHLDFLATDANRMRSKLDLLSVKVFASASLGMRPKPHLFDNLRDTVESAELLGLGELAAYGWHLISWSMKQGNDSAGAERAILRAEEWSRSAGDHLRCEQLALSGRCLLEVEGDIGRARVFLAEAGHLASCLNVRMVELDWGDALIARWDGELPIAIDLMRRALKLSRLRQDRWREIECLVWIVKLEIEAGNVDLDAYLAEIDALAERLGDGPSPVAATFRVLTSMLGGSVADRARLGGCLMALRALDDKAQLAYVLNQFASVFLDRGEAGLAEAYASEALEAATAVNRPTEMFVAKSILRLICGRASNAEELDSLSSDLSARAREFLEKARASRTIPTPTQTNIL